MVDDIAERAVALTRDVVDSGITQSEIDLQYWIQVNICNFFSKICPLFRIKFTNYLKVIRKIRAEEGGKSLCKAYYDED